ncbi:hypothetical protein M406DRAFT_245783 [Cryphonectria parasitica EP155]|uniref:ER transporter 6TM N-terminal domain-containing protein n=1 Tax=Cryphonectria parasitica (strain ATCC 38755 / EP155) TaxID=660469 RepID=A0A9P5CTQ3_CRYP1|nr:uncharacterized protein M406DRAFT_245783 [Cryphonectria parasitica EP155]KAF3770583.1 hypothetical protein M406DRAFT_245783 [Cryphonectria parasitica EP155]
MAAHPAPAPANGDAQSRHSSSQEDLDTLSSSSSDAPGLTTPAATFVLDDRTENNDDAAAAKSAAGPSFFRRAVQRLGLNSVLLMSMFKGSMAPVICIAIYQAAAVRQLLTTLGYLSAVISVLSLAPLPRGKFLQNMVLNLLSMSAGAGMGILVTWSSVQARLHTSNLLELEQYIETYGRAPYNASQSAVCGVWLFFNIWAVNIFRAKFPAFNLPVIIYSIFINISSTFGPQFPTVKTAESFIRELLIAMLIGLGVGAGCSLFVFPISTRQIVVKQMGGVLGLFKKAITLEKEYLQGLEKADMFTIEVTETSTGQPSDDKKAGKKDAGPPLTGEQKTAMALRGVLTASRELMGKIYADLKFAKRDVAIGYLTPKDFGHLYDLMRGFMIPMTGIGGVSDEAQYIGGFIRDAVDKEDSQRIWNDIMQQLHEPFEILSEALLAGIDHAAILMRILPPSKEQKKASDKKKSRADTGAEADVEESGADLRPGEVGYSKVVQEKMDLFNSRRGEILRVWAKDKGLTQQLERRQNDQIQLFVVLYLEKLMQATGEAVMDFVSFAEEKHRDGSITKKHLIAPSLHHLRKWALSIFQEDDSSGEDSPDILERGGNVVFVGEAWLHKKDPEHLPPTNALEKIGNSLRNFSNFFGSAESIFGLRVAIATMTVGIAAFLESSQAFFIEQRVVWALIIIAIGMTQTSGQSIFGFFCRVAGTAVAMVNCYIIWYIVDTRLPGVLVFLWLFTFVEYYFFFKYPRFIPMVMICIVTQYLIIGYELQTQALGIAASTASGQRYYPLYELAPYRLATVAGGALVAFFWTVFPRPLTDRTWLRKDLSATLYLLANYYSVIYTTMRSALTEDIGSTEIPGSAAHSLFKVRRKLYGKLLLLIPSIQAHTNFQKFEPSLGGKFPAEQYQDMIHRCTRMMNYFTLMSYILTYAPKESVEESDRAWRRVLGEVLDEVTPLHVQMLSTLTLLSNALMSGQSLPPLMALPKPYEMTRRLLSFTPIQSDETEAHNAPASPSSPASAPSFGLRRSESRGMASNSGGDNSNQQQLDEIYEPEAWNLLDARNMEQKGYTEFAVFQVASTLVLSELHGLLRTIQELVGTVDFSFRVEPKNTSQSSLESVLRLGTWTSRATMAEAQRSKTGNDAGNGVQGKGKQE